MLPLWRRLTIAALTGATLVLRELIVELDPMRGLDGEEEEEEPEEPDEEPVE